jgi:hypothetical protein
VSVTEFVSFLFVRIYTYACLPIVLASGPDIVFSVAGSYILLFSWLVEA